MIAALWGVFAAHPGGIDLLGGLLALVMIASGVGWYRQR